MTEMTYLVGAFGAFFAILNPPGNMPLFLAYTKDLPPKSSTILPFFSPGSSLA